jgi:hypothetical protein
MNHDIDRTQVGFGSELGSAPYPGRGGHPDAPANLAADLLDVKSEQEFEYFLGDVISGAANAVGKFISSPTGQALGSGLKDVAKTLLPVAGQALGDYVGGATGGQIGGALGSAVAGSFEMASEEQEWEAANTFVKIASDAAKNAAQMPQGGDPNAIAKKAIIEAAKVHAPGLVPTLTGEGHCNCHECRHRHHEHEGHHHHHYGHSGRWYRHGGRIVLEGV